MTAVKRARKRGYDAPARRAAAEATRTRIVTAARALFVSRGYAVTTIEGIAGAAGVSVQTVYAAFGSKRALLFALLDMMTPAAELGQLDRALAAAAGPAAQLGALVAFGVRLHRREADLIEAIRAAGTADRDLGDAWRNGEQRRRSAQLPIVRAWAAAGALRDGVSEREAADVLWAWTGADGYRLLVVERGWSAKKLEIWLFAALRRLLFAEGTA